ncbi:MAG: flavodoxin family protein [Elusimicrobia bacterium]|nr:flavodoxin family protein [Elusimicrobiota bacterium]MBU2614589.1 flavodoxin family protein [Elusimicrobiota bacterium]
MKLLAIYGSPRKDGNSDILLDEAWKGAGITAEKVYIRDLDIKPCTGCRSCDSTGKCIISDDMAQLYKKIEEADRIILSSPIFFYGLPGKLKGMADRAQCYWVRKYKLKSGQPRAGKFDRKLGSFICVGATAGEKLFDGVKLTVKYFYDVFNIEYFSELLVRKVDNKGDILATNSPKEAQELGRKLCEPVHPSHS